MVQPHLTRIGQYGIAIFTAFLAFTSYRVNVVIDKIDNLVTHEAAQDGKLEVHEQRFTFIEREIDDVKSRLNSKARSIVQQTEKE